MPEHDPRPGAPDTRTPSGRPRVLCSRCSNDADPADTVTSVFGSTICGRCRDLSYWACSTCGGWNLVGYSCGNDCDTDDDGDYYRDDDAYDDDENSTWGSVHDYTYKPSPVFHGPGPLFLGLELEVATPYGRREDCARTASSHLGGLGYLKADESIGGGFEIVTHPMAYAWALENFPWPMLATLESAGCSATDRTGLHVHLSRTGFDGPCHTYRWMKFIHRNQPHVTALARRDTREWASFRDEDRLAVKDYAKGERGYDRYRAINTLNPATFELRVFASSLQTEVVQAALGFTAASVEYTRHLTIQALVHDAWAWPAFTQWLRRRPEYEALTRQATELTRAPVPTLAPATTGTTGATGVAACAC